MQHKWVASNLGHGSKMCRHCCITDREAAALGCLNECDAPPPKPQTANDNKKVSVDDGEYYGPGLCDDDDEDDFEDGAECGQMSDGTCMMAGTEYCDFECPYRDD